MPFIKEIVSAINDSISTAVTVQNFKTKFFGLATPVDREDINPESYPVVLDGKNEVAIGDDNYHLVIYHRIIDSSYEVIEGFGDDDDEMEIMQMRMIIWANPKALATNKDNLLQVIASKLPSSVDPMNDNIFSINIQKKNIINESKQLFGQEYKGVAYRVDPEHLFAGVNYAIETQYDRVCLTMCEPCL